MKNSVEVSQLPSSVIAIAGKFIDMIGFKKSKLIIMPEHPNRYLTEFRKVANFQHCASHLIEYESYHLKIYTLTLCQGQEILKEKFYFFHELISSKRRIKTNKEGGNCYKI